VQILTDYDMTLTKERYLDGRKADSAFRTIQDSRFVPEDIKLETRKLYDRFSPIELDYTIPPAEKSTHMMTWWEHNLRIYSALGLTREDFLNMVLESRLLFRNGLGELMSTNDRLKIPFYVVSGGITEIIQSHFMTVMHNGEVKNESVASCWETTKVFSNEFNYEADKTVGFKLPIIHVLNKQEVIYNSNIDFKRNVIVMGDLLEDIGMVRQSEHDVVLKIGFLNNLEKHG
jgi:HAD superfamily hydrolase (TIGR01544 family)